MGDPPSLAGACHVMVTAELVAVLMQSASGLPGFSTNTENAVEHLISLQFGYNSSLVKVCAFTKLLLV